MITLAGLLGLYGPGQSHGRSRRYDAPLSHVGVLMVVMSCGLRRVFQRRLLAVHTFLRPSGWRPLGTSVGRVA
eukprot:2111461-Alexandrium_andersonii.AAC.1